MKIEKAQAMFQLMKQYGVSHFKDDDGVEIRFADNAAIQSPQQQEIPKQQLELVPQNKSKKKVPPPQAIPVTNPNIPHQLSEVMSMLKLSDNELVEKIFPDPVASKGAS